MPVQSHVLIAVLDWGLGHATRCMPLIQAFMAKGCKVSIAGAGPSLALLKLEYPHLEFHQLAPYQVSYSASLPFMVKMFLQLPKFLKMIRAEHNQLESLVVKHNIDFVVSDNRYGCWSKRAPSVLITHQLNLIMPPVFAWLGGCINYLNHRFIRKFDLCWVPDFEQERITGKLTKHINLKMRFIGMLSRFIKSEKSSVDPDFVLAIISGPEPQRQTLETILERELSLLNKRCVIVRGILIGAKRKHERIEFINYATSGHLSELIENAGVVICRSGYSTMMDLTTLDKKNVILIPTPGQTEQEYLAQVLEDKKIALKQSQSEINIREALDQLESYEGFTGIRRGTNLLTDAVSGLLEMKKVV